MDFELRPLPYAYDALEPALSRETLVLHHDRHHAAYLKKLKELIGGKGEGKAPLEAIVKSARGAIFDNAAQVWNHDFLWRSMAPKPKGGGEPDGPLASAIERDFGSFADFRTQLLDAGGDHFGSGWLWLVADADRLSILTTHDADTPLRTGRNALFTIDLWEHAYYVDYRNERASYLESFVDHLVDWAFATENWKNARR
jgi:Fe-Mn family superoxide dismutase